MTAGEKPTYGQTHMQKARWKFGVGQAYKEERAEIEAAQAAGLSDRYIEGQAHARRIEAERARRRNRDLGAETVRLSR